MREKESTIPTVEIAYLASEVQSLRAAVISNDANQLKLGEQLALNSVAIDKIGKDVAEVKTLNSAAIEKIGKDVSDVKTLLQVGRALGTFAVGVRWLVVWVTPIVILIGLGYGFWQWVLGKGPFPH